MPTVKVIATEDLFLNAAQSKVVTAGESAAFLLVRAGKQVPPVWADKIPKKPVKKAPAKKSRKKPADKERKAGGDK